MESNPEIINKFLDVNGNYEFDDKYYRDNHKPIPYKNHWLYDAELYQKYDKYISLKQPNTFGIVSSGGNIHHLHMIHVQISILFELNNQYDIEIFVDKQVNNTLLKQCKYIFNEQHKIQKYNFSIKCIEIDDEIFFALNPFSNKPNVIIQSSFQHILFLDTDNICLRNPKVLFDSEIYNKYGAILWPESHVFTKGWCKKKYLFLTTIDPDIDKMSFELYKSLNLTYDNNEIRYHLSIESGQILINSIQNTMALLVTINCCNSKLIQSLLYGDKDCFKLSFLKTKSLFYIVPRIPNRVYGGLLQTYMSMAQFWIDGKLFFLHGYDTFFCGDMFTLMQIWDANYDCNKRLNTNSIFLPFIYHIKYEMTKYKISKSDSLSIQRLELLYHESYHYVCSLVFSEDCECVYFGSWFRKTLRTVIVILVFVCFIFFLCFCVCNKGKENI